jgi:hypothetical protein
MQIGVPFLYEHLISFDNELVDIRIVFYCSPFSFGPDIRLFGHRELRFAVWGIAMGLASCFVFDIAFSLERQP